jgi:ATP phosphoribosyltransferase
MLTIALAKGRTAEDILPLLQQAGIAIPDSIDDSRALVFQEESPAFGQIRYLLAKPADVPTYVTYGVADLGVVGKDILLESEKEVYELLDLERAVCRLCVAGRPVDESKRPERVATKYPRLADAYFRQFGQAVEIVPLGGSIELAAVIGLADRVFDLVQSGSTLQANGLIVFDEVYNISARLVANKSSYRLNRGVIDQMTRALAQAVTLGSVGRPVR